MGVYYRENMCDMCLEIKQVRRVDLYISGSEGTLLCNGCEKGIVRFIRDNRMIVFRKRREETKTERR